LSHPPTQPYPPKSSTPCPPTARRDSEFNSPPRPQGPVPLQRPCLCDLRLRWRSHGQALSPQSSPLAASPYPSTPKYRIVPGLGFRFEAFSVSRVRPNPENLWPSPCITQIAAR